MDNVYKFAGYQAPASVSELYTPRERVYNLDSFRAKVPVRANDTWWSGSAYFLLSYSDGSYQRVPVKSYVDETTFVPKDEPPLPRQDMLVGLTLLALIENHCMTFWLPDNQAATPVEMMDAFYNHQHPPSPYRFGAEERFSLDNLTILDGFLPGGTIEVQAAPDYTTTKEIPVYLDLLPYSKRTEAQAHSETHTYLQYCGISLAPLDIAQLLASPTLYKDKLRFATNLLAWDKIPSTPPSTP